MSQERAKGRRPNGTGSIFEHNGSVTFRFRPAPGKPQVQRKVCRIGEMTKTTIERRCREIEREFKPVEGSAGNPTVIEAATAHIKQLELDGKAKSYTKGRWRYLRLYLEPFFEEQKVDQPKVKDIKRFKGKLQNEGKGAATIISVLWLLSGTFKFAMQEEWRTDNPVASVEKPEVKNTHPVVYMTSAEVNKIIAAVPDDEFGRVERVLYRAAQKSGMRRSELLALHWTEFDELLDVFRVEWAWVEGELKKPKGKESRVIPILPDLKSELQNWRKITRFPGGEDLIFADPLTGAPLSPGKVSKRFKKALLNAGVGPSEMREYAINGKTVLRRHMLWEFRDLRDVFGTTLMMDPDISPREVQEWMGHASLTTTSARYSGFVPSLDAAERMAKAFGDKAENRSSDGPQTEPEISEAPRKERA